MANLNEIQQSLLDVEEKRRSLWGLYKKSEPQKISLPLESDPDFIGITDKGTREHQLTASREFYKLMFILQQFNVTLTYDKRKHVCVMGYGTKTLLLCKKGKQYHAISGKDYVDITYLIQSMHKDIKDRASTIEAARKFKRIREDLYGIRAIFMDPWKKAPQVI